MVQTGIEYLDKLAADAGDRADLRREFAAGFLRVGDVQGRPFNPNLGDSAGALASYQKTVSLYSSLGVTTESPADLRSEAALAHLRLSEIHGALGDTKAAMADALTGLELVRAVATNPAAPPTARRDLAVGYSGYGDVLAATGATAKAIEYHRRALGVMQALAAEHPDDFANLRQLGVAHHSLGNVLGNPNYPNIGDHAGGLAKCSNRLRSSQQPHWHTVHHHMLGFNRALPARPVVHERQ